MTATFCRWLTRATAQSPIKLHVGGRLGKRARNHSDIHNASRHPLQRVAVALALSGDSGCPVVPGLGGRRRPSPTHSRLAGQRGPLGAFQAVPVIHNAQPWLEPSRSDSTRKAARIAHSRESALASGNRWYRIWGKPRGCTARGDNHQTQGSSLLRVPGAWVGCGCVCAALAGRRLPRAGALSAVLTTPPVCTTGAQQTVLMKSQSADSEL